MRPCSSAASPNHPPTLCSTPTVEMSTSIRACFLCSSPTEGQLLGILRSVPSPSLLTAGGASWSLGAQPQVNFEQSDSSLCVSLFTRLAGAPGRRLATYLNRSMQRRSQEGLRARTKNLVAEIGQWRCKLCARARMENAQKKWSGGGKKMQPSKRGEGLGEQRC